MTILLALYTNLNNTFFIYVVVCIINYDYYLANVRLSIVLIYQ